MEEVVRITDVKQQFGQITVLEGVNLSINQGEIVGLLGPSGSGKTTLVKGIVGMGIPTRGEIVVMGEKMPSLRVVPRIGYMAQSDALYEDLTAYDNLLYFGALYGWKGKRAKKRAEEILSLVELTADAKKPVHQFSGGMKRRLSLATALFHHPPLVILDEPTVGIDPVLRRQFWKEFNRLRDLGATILITTHVMDEAEHCDRLAFLRNGHLTATGSPDTLKANAGVGSVEEAFLHFGTKSEGEDLQ